MNFKHLILALFFIITACADKIDLKLIDNSFCVIDTQNDWWVDKLYLYKIDSLNRTICRNEINRIHKSKSYSDTICFFKKNDGYRNDTSNCLIESGFKYKIVASNPGFEDIIFFKVDEKNNISLINN